MGAPLSRPLLFTADRISTETLGPGNCGKFILGTPFLTICGDFSQAEMRMAKVDMLGRGDKYLNF